ncbi:MAG: glyoxalase [Gammaproteobacteria bacterium]|jgi:catechol 2,3-dioxygenase-like lactoylglutathione lyase family enzyme|nr:glyoxalase [Gammaproteobacteria bacterium]|tara:strand:+ start:1454 stop:1900 length:447 start_codon:yes stop_codon:yes gene_type:complete
MKVSFHHAGIVVTDLDQGIEFYKKFLGLEDSFPLEWSLDKPGASEAVINLKDSAATGMMLSGDGFNIELFEYTAPEQKGDPASGRPCDFGIRHIAFEFDDIHEAAKRLVDAGGSMHREPVELGTLLAVYCRDPFGNIIELMQPVEETA